jgi:hypothetical protein
MASVTTSIDPTTGGVTISWTAPENGSDTIDAYLIKIYNPSTSTYSADTTDCNGSSSTVMTNMYCIIPMSVLTSTYGYGFNVLVLAQV